jgi:hypothetical protein
MSPVYRLIDIAPDLAVCPCPGMVVKKVDDDSCLLFTPGQSALEGFLVESPWEQVIGDLNDELERSVEETGDYDDEEDEDEDDKNQGEGD